MTNFYVIYFAQIRNVNVYSVSSAVHTLNFHKRTVYPCLKQVQCGICLLSTETISVIFRDITLCVPLKVKRIGLQLAFT
jgi:hypothetical protein